MGNEEDTCSSIRPVVEFLMMCKVDSEREYYGYAHLIVESIVLCVVGDGW